MKITTSIESTRRGRNTLNGNPTVAVTTVDGQVYLTERDATVGYEIERFDPTKNPDAPTVAVLTLRDGRITHVEEAEFL